jgi:protein-tyrosine-phosphatase
MSNVLFVCTGNSCGSQKAEDSLRALASDRTHAEFVGIVAEVITLFRERVEEIRARVTYLVSQLDSGCRKGAMS